MSEGYERLRAMLREAATLSSAGELLAWDQETMMPPKAAPFRAEELALLARLAHERATDPRIEELLAACEADSGLVGDPAIAADLREIRRDYDRALRLPAELVAEISATGSRAMEVWKPARRESDFAAFAPWLGKLVELNRRKAACYGAPPGGDLYDALLEDYEPGARGAELARLFGPLRQQLVPLIEQIAGASRRPDESALTSAVPLELQRRFHLRVLEQVGFDLEAGRLDLSTHPFSTGLGPGDTRITTRYEERTFLDGLGSTLHEAGHALYEQGLPKEPHHGEPRGQTLGLGIHESQSRMWENHVGRSRAFWTWALPEAARIVGGRFRELGVDEIYGAVNVVRPGLIRVESDEATYNLHVLLRWDLERAMLLGDLRTAELPGAWNERMRSDLGLEVPDDRRGCLQDIHWSMGSIGYFPTYTLGNLYAAQFWEALVDEVSDVEERMARGEFDALLGWLRRTIHAHGRRWPAAELCQRLTGRPLSHEPLLRHLRAKLGPLYGLASATS